MRITSQLLLWKGKDSVRGKGMEEGWWVSSSRVNLVPAHTLWAAQALYTWVIPSCWCKREKNSIDILCQSQLYNVVWPEMAGDTHVGSGYFQDQCCVWADLCGSYDCKTSSAKTIRKLWRKPGLLLTCPGGSVACLGPHREVLSRECTGIMVSLIGIKVGPRASGFTLYCWI